MTYYEVEGPDARDGLPNGVQSFDSLDEAIAFAEANDRDRISTCGGDWEDYGKCWFCGDWVPVSEIGTTDACWRCELELYSRGEL